MSPFEISPRGAELAHILTRVGAGDLEAAAWLYDTFAPQLYRRLRGRYAYPGGPDPEDLLQDAFIFFLRNRGKVLHDFLRRVPPASQTCAELERHLWNLACGVASNWRRSARRRRVLPLADVGSRMRVPSDEKAALDRDVLERLDACLRAGKKRVYVYYKLRYHDGFTPEEISRMTGWSRKATYKLRQDLNVALERCAQRLGIGLGENGA